MMSREEREKKVLELHYDQDKRIRDIAKELHLSFTTINDIIKRDRQQKERQQQTEMKRSNIIDDGNGNGNGVLVLVIISSIAYNYYSVMTSNNDTQLRITLAT
jgi:AraC-like DNA-binding protein